MKKELDILLPLEGDEKVKEGKGLEILTPNKLLTRLPVLLTQIKTVINSRKLKNETWQIMYLLNQRNKITNNLKQFNQFIIVKWLYIDVYKVEIK